MSDQDNTPQNHSQPDAPKRPRLIIPGQEPQPVPQPEPTPQAAPAPQPQYAPQPEPTPQAAPAPAPQPQYAPQPDPTPQAAPAPQPQYAPQPDPTPQAAPAPQPQYAPQPEPTPQAAPAPQPQYAPQPDPTPQAAPAPQPQPVPQPEPTPQAQPAPAPVPQPAAPAPPQVEPSSPQVLVPLAGSPVPPQNPAPVARAAPPLLVGGTAAAAPRAQAPGGMPPGPGAPGQPPLGGAGMSTLAPKPKKGVSNAVKMMIAITLLAAIIIISIVIKGNSDANDRTERLNEIAALFKDPTSIPEEIPLSGQDVDWILSSLISTQDSDENKREFHLRALNLGVPTDGGNISEAVANFAKDTDMEKALRAKLFRVVERRGDESALPILIAFASQTDVTESGQAALKAASGMADVSNFQSLLAIVTNSPNASIKSSAVITLSEVIANSDNPSSFAKPIISSFKSVTDDDSRSALLRLMGSAGGDEAADLVADSLESNKATMQVAAIYALRYWPDDSQFQTLLEFAQTQNDKRVRSEAFTNLVDFLKDGSGGDEDRYPYWKEVAVMATGETEQRRVVSALSQKDGRWADDVLDYFLLMGDTAKVVALAEDTKDRLIDNIRSADRNKRLEKRNGGDDKE